MRRLSAIVRKINGPAPRGGALPLVAALFLVLLSSHTGYGEDAMSLSDDIRKIELSDIRCNRQSADYFGYLKGSIPILISAPHGARHYRTSENRWKAEDAYTSSWAIKLGRLTGAHVLYVKNKTSEDPNNDRRTRYKDSLAKIVQENGIRFVIDLHGAGRAEPFKIDVGTIDDGAKRCSCPTYRPIIEKAFQGFDAPIFNKRFTARRSCTITNFARNVLGIEAAQFEINARYRIIQSRANPDLRADEADVLDLMERMQGMIMAINEKISGAGSEDRRSVSLLHTAR